MDKELKAAIHFADNNILLAEKEAMKLPTSSAVGYFIRERVKEMRLWSEIGRPDSFSEPTEVFEKFKLAKKLIGNGPGKLLDVGTFTGYFVRYVCKDTNIEGLGVDLFDMDYASEMAYVDKVNATFVSCASEKINEHWHNAFDYVTCMDVLEHCFNEKAVIQAIEDVAKDGALIIYNLPLWKPMQVPGHVDPIDFLRKHMLAEHLRPYRKKDVIRLFGHKKNFKMYPMKDENGNKTLFFSYENER